MSFLPGMFPAMALSSGLYVPASYIFNGSDEYLVATQTGTSSDQTRWCCSFWMKSSSGPPNTFFTAIMNAYPPAEADSEGYGVNWYDDQDSLVLDHFHGGSYRGVTGSPSTINNDGNWYHYFARWNSTAASANDRLFLARNGVEISYDERSNPGLSAAFLFFTDGNDLHIGNDTFYQEIAKRLAFIDVVDGVSASPTDFAFDDGGTWTRKRYNGDHGTHGFSLDGSAGFVDTINGRVFTGTNMTTGSNLDTADLPPYTN